jgi:hypothetical protein
MTTDSRLLSEPIRIPYIVISDPVDLAMYQLFGNILYFFSRHTGINTSGFTDRILQYHGAGRNDRIAVHDRIIHHDSSHPDQYIIMQRAAVHDRMMTDRDIIPNCCAIPLESAMDAGAILHIYFVTDLNEVHIASDNRIEPETAIITGDHIANDGGIGCNETIVPELRVFVFYGKYYRH